MTENVTDDGCEYEVVYVFETAAIIYVDGSKERRKKKNK